MAWSKALRNRIIGLLVIVSLVLIVLPALMSPSEIYKRSPDAIAVDKNGTLNAAENAEQNGQAAPTDYSDLLAPVDDSKEKPALPEIKAAANESAKQGLNDGAPLNQSFDDNPPVVDDLPFDVPHDNPYVAMLQNDSAFVKSEDTPKASVVKPQADTQAKKEPIKSAELKSNQVKESAPVKAATPEKKSAPAQVATQAKTKDGAFWVQAGVYSQQTGANNAVQKLKAAGYTARTEKVVVNGKSMIKVFAASAATREQAQALARKIKQSTGLETAVAAR